MMIQFLSDPKMQKTSRNYRMPIKVSLIFSTHIKSQAGMCIGAEVRWLAVFLSTRTGLPALSGCGCFRTTGNLSMSSGVGERKFEWANVFSLAGKSAVA
jgi:hypothetical protein